MTKIADIELLQIPTIEDLRGNLAFVQNDILPFELKRIYPNNFVLDILNKTPLTEESINQNIKLVNSFLSRMRDSLNFNGHIYIPTNDCYFLYDVPHKNIIQFA